MNSTNNDELIDDPDFVNLMHGTYSDILFIVLPFLAIMLQRFWSGDTEGILLKPDFSIIAAILAGLSISKFVLGLINEQTLNEYKERIVFFIALSVFAVLLPAIILIIKLTSGEEIPEFISFIQPLLLIVAVSLYTGAVSVSKILSTKPSENNEIEASAPADSALMSLDKPSSTKKEF
ncbi:MAG: hypothetical protein ACJAS1_001776 [Oleiphilaceae bacterium]|jgi:hypothetical protein